MKKSGIYKITSPSNRIYIGQSSDLKERFRRYKHLHRSKLLTKLYRSFLKYGIENHKFEIIEECLPELLNERERYWQDYYNVNSKNGLNCRLTTTENKSGGLSEETKKKIGIGNKGKVMSEEAKLKISQSKKGKKIPKESLILFSECKKKKVRCIEDNLIFDSVGATLKYYKISSWTLTNNLKRGKKIKKLNKNFEYV